MHFSLAGCNGVMCPASLMCSGVMWWIACHIYRHFPFKSAAKFSVTTWLSVCFVNDALGAVGYPMRGKLLKNE